jgi:hypothetical protein
MSAKSDKFEINVAKNIDKFPGIIALRPKVGTEYADVLLEFDGKKTWLEVKMSHTDNLSNPRVFYKHGRWNTTYKTPSAKLAVDILNKSSQTRKFLEDLSKFSDIPLDDIKIPTTKGGLKENGAVPLEIMKKYFSQSNINRYIATEENMNMGSIVTEHYTKGKKEPAYYMQAGDDFYRISKKDPFNIGRKIPELSGVGDFKVRVATRSQFYEVQAEMKIKKMPNSLYSLKPDTKKKNPFLKY